MRQARQSHRRPRLSPAIAIAVLAWLAAGLLLAAPQATAALNLVPVGGTFNKPIHMTAPPGDNRRLFVVERGGTIRVVLDGVQRGTPFLTIPGGVSVAGERGLLSMAFDPAYAQNRRFYVFYTTPTDGNPSGGDIRIDQFKRFSDRPNVADPSTRRRILTIEHSARTTHYAGQLQFGPDGFLYISTGDGGGINDPDGNGQDTDSLLGKLLRIAPRASGEPRYTSPSGNPFVGEPGRDEIWAYGLRNPFRFSFDRKTGDLTIGDVGQDRADEVDFLSPNRGGANFGWNCYEGFQRTPGVPPCDPPGHVFPVLERVLPSDSCGSLTGGYVVRDDAIESLLGRYIYGDYCTGELRSTLLRTDGAVDDKPLGLGFAPFSLVSFGEDARGGVYLVSIKEGKLFKLAD
jgi:glucose/arabinose dehydrogenase